VIAGVRFLGCTLWTDFAVRIGSDLVARWDAEYSAGDVWLQAALMVATALPVKAVVHGEQEAKNFADIGKAVECIRMHPEGLQCDPNVRRHGEFGGREDSSRAWASCATASNTRSRSWRRNSGR